MPFGSKKIKPRAPITTGTRGYSRGTTLVGRIKIRPSWAGYNGTTVPAYCFFRQTPSGEPIRQYRPTGSHHPPALWKGLSGYFTPSSGFF